MHCLNGIDALKFKCSAVSGPSHAIKQKISNSIFRTPERMPPHTVQLIDVSLHVCSRDIDCRVSGTVSVSA
jgi:hypothetical protein